MAEKADPALKSRAWNTSKVTAHHAIIPTGEKKDLAALSSDERKIFHAVARAYIAQFYEPAVYRQSKAVIDCMGHIFTASSKTLRKDGWTALYPKKRPREIPGGQVRGDGSRKGVRGHRRGSSSA